MKSPFWIILGFIAIVLGTILPILGFYIAYESIFLSKNLSAFFGNFFIIGAISQILFWGGIISAVFGMIKYYKEK